MRVVCETGIGPLKFAVALDIDRLVTVDQYVGNRGIGEQGLQRPEPHDFVLDALDNKLPLFAAQGCGRLDKQPLDDFANFLACLVGLDGVDERQIEHRKQMLVDALLPFCFLSRHGTGPVCFIDGGCV